MQKIFPSFLLILIFLLCFASCEVVEVNDSNFEAFQSTNSLYMLLLCSSRIPKCKKLKSKLLEISRKAHQALNIDLIIAYVEIESLKSNSSILSQFPYEGFASIYYINSAEGEKEAYIGAKEVKNILRYLKFKLIHKIETASDEKDLTKQMKSSKLEVATIFFGDILTSPFSVQNLSRASKLSGIEKVYIITNKDLLEKYKVNDWEVGLFNLKSEAFTMLNLQDEDELTIEKISQIIMINKRNLRGFFSNLRAVDLELSLTKLVPTLFFIYEEKSQLLPNTEKDITDLAKRYKNEFLLFKSAINSKPLKTIQLKQFFNLTSADLPALVLTAKNTNADSSTDDVEKFIVKNSELLAQKEKYLKIQKEAKGDLSETNQNDINELINKRVVENFLENFKKGKLYKTYFSEYEEYEMKMTGDNFIEVIDNALEESKAVVLLICPKISKKYERARLIMQRTFEKIWEVNQNQILFDEFDPFVNELGNVNYHYIPTVAIIRKNPDSFASNKWLIDLKEKGFTTKSITEFVGSHFEEMKLNMTRTDSEAEEEEERNPLWPILKTRFDSKFLAENVVKFDVGFRRRWTWAKKQGLVLADEDLTEFATFNEWEEDYEPDDYAANDNVAVKTEEKKVDL